MIPDIPSAPTRKTHYIAPLKNFWFFGLLGSALKPGKMQPIKLQGLSVLLGRTNEGKVFAMRNYCPHRSTPLHHGLFDGKEVQCLYHGWRFAPNGQCTAIPALCESQGHYGDKLRNKVYPCEESQGIIWVFAGDLPEGSLPPVPTLPDIGDAVPQIHLEVAYPLNAEHAAYTFFDPAHVAFVHSSPFIHRKSHSIRAKVKNFEPCHLGWHMKAHPVPRENMLYRLFGKNATTEISYLLPGTRIEHIKGDKHWLISIATLQPISDEETVIHQVAYWSFPWLSPFKGLLRYLILHFLTEDRKYALMQGEGLEQGQPFIYVGDADTQIQWYQQLRQAWLRSDSGAQPFVNPLKPGTLKFNS